MKDTVDRVVSLVPYLKSEFEVVVDTLILLKKIRYFKSIKKELLDPISITKESAHAILNEHNRNVLSSMREEVSAAEEVFFKHPERNYKHLEKFIRVTKSYYFGGINFPEKTDEVINKNFNEVDIEPDLLDATYIDDYIGILDALEEYLKNELWDEINLYWKYISNPESNTSFSDIDTLEKGSDIVSTAQKPIAQFIETHKMNSQELKESLLQYGLNEFLKQKGWQDKVDKIISVLSDKDNPFKIAFLLKIGYVKFLVKEYCKTSKERDALLGGILGTSERRIKGNINVLTPNSKEDKGKYTAHQHEEDIKDILMDF